MDKVASKLGKILKITGIGLLIGIIVISWMQAGASQLKSKSLITCEGDSSDTIIIVQERSRGRVFFDFFKKMTFTNSIHQNSCSEFQLINSFELKSLFMNAYQRNVFYVYAFSTVP